MRIYGIIAEYNPFHNGHLYQIEETRRNGATHIIAVMSGNYVQRGDVAIIDKFQRAELAVKNGVDMVIELPTPYALSTAEFFARGAVSILGSLGCVEGISFGSECGDIAMLEQAAFAVDNISNSTELKSILKSGISYPNAMQSLISANFGERVAKVLSHPNNLLGIEYIRAMHLLNLDFNLFTIQRKSASHDSTVATESIASASYIRNALTKQLPYDNLVPNDVFKVLTEYKKQGKISDISNIEQAILYRLRTMSIDEIAHIPDVSQGLENRIYNAAKTSNNLEQLEFEIKTKRYPLAKIRRILISALLGIEKDYIKISPPYGRILAINSAGCEILKRVKVTSKIPLGTSLLKLSQTSVNSKIFSVLETRTTDIYALSTDKIQPCGLEFTTKIQKL